MTTVDRHKHEAAAVHGAVVDPGRGVTAASKPSRTSRVLVAGTQVGLAGFRFLSLAVISTASRRRASDAPATRFTLRRP